MSEAIELAEAQRRMERRTYKPRGAVATLLESSAPELLIDGPTRTGKSRGCLEKLHRSAMRYAGARILIVRKTRASLSETILQTYEDEVLGSGNPICAGASRQFRQSYRYPNGSVVVVGGMDKPTRIMSSEYDLIYVPEAIELTVTDWESLATRLSARAMPYTQLLADTNPGAPDHWLKRRCDAGVTLLLHSRHEDNPVLYDAAAGDWTDRGRAYIARLETLTGVRKLRLRFGQWAQAEGAVYEMWNEAVHLIDPFPIPAHWRRVRVVDFGYTNPFVCQWWAIDPDGRMYLYREIYMTRRRVDEHAEVINRLSKGEQIEATIADHDAEDRATLAAAGISTSIADKDISTGIQAVQARLVPAADGRPRLFIMRDVLVEVDADLNEAGKPVTTAGEFGNYVWATGGTTAKEVPVKVDDHGMDAMRYAVKYVDSPAPQAMVRAKTTMWAKQRPRGRHL